MLDGGDDVGASVGRRVYQGSRSSGSRYDTVADRPARDASSIGQKQKKNRIYT
jgi:hypothetical protein